MGAHNIKTNEPWQLTVNSTDFFTHEDWNATMLSNDIAVIKLKGTLKLTRFVRPVCLTNTVINNALTVVDWGLDEYSRNGEALLSFSVIF